MAEPIGVQFEEAIGYLRAKTRLPTRTWTDIWEAMHGRAFVVAGAMADQLIADFHEAVTDAIANGRSLEQFREDFDRIVARHGWSYKGSRNWRSKVIYETNLRMAHAAGRWAQIQRVKETRPYLRYVAVMDSRTRPQHAEWNDTILSVDDPWWESHYPPNGWNCRCAVQSLSARDMKLWGLKVSDTAPPIEEERRRLKRGDGTVTLVTVPKGIDTGFAYNAGIAGFGRGAQKAALEKHGKFEGLDAPGAPAYQLAPLEPVVTDIEEGPAFPPDRPEELVNILRKALGHDEVVLTDPAGGSVLIGQALVDHILESKKRQDGRERYFPFIPDLVRDPQEIWIGFARSEESGRVVLRRRYVKIYRTNKNRAFALVADADGNVWSAVTFLRGSPRYLQSLRSGLRVYVRQEEG